MFNIKGTSMRSVHTAIKKKYPKAVESFLRIEQITTSNMSRVPFLVTVGDGNKVTINEKRLNLNDRFIVTAIAMNVYKVGAASPTPAQYASSRLRTWANPIVFAKAGEADAFNALYTNGLLKIKNDYIENFPGLECSQFERVPTYQKGVGTGVVVQEDAYDGSDGGYIPITPTITLSGNGTNEISIEMPTAVDLTGTASVNVIVLRFKGMLLPNANKAAQ